jgi:hypothetical protein
LFVAVLGGFVFAPVPLCPTRNWLHVPCPGCGATRAILLAAKGDFAASFHLHPLALPAAVLMLPTLYVFARGVAHDEVSPQLPKPLRAAWKVFVAALISVWIARFFGAFGGPAPI